MPEMDGIEATRALMERDPACVVIVAASREPGQIKGPKRRAPWTMS